MPRLIQVHCWDERIAEIADRSRVRNQLPEKFDSFSPNGRGQHAHAAHVATTQRSRLLDVMLWSSFEGEAMKRRARCSAARRVGVSMSPGLNATGAALQRQQQLQ